MEVRKNWKKNEVQERNEKEKKWKNKIKNIQVKTSVKIFEKWKIILKIKCDQDFLH